MRAALHGSLVDYVIYVGMTENYPRWFKRQVLDDIYMNSDRYTFWVPKDERQIDYYEKTLVEEYSVFLRNKNGEVHCTTYEVFLELYVTFKWDLYSNSGIAAYSDDCIEYVECEPGVLFEEYPDWFYEYFTESVHFPQEKESIFIYELDTTDPPITANSKNVSVIEPLDSNIGQVSITEHCVFLRNHLGEIRYMDYDSFTDYYNPGPFREVDHI